MVHFDKYKIRAALRVIEGSKESAWDREMLGFDYYANISEEEIKERSKEIIFDLLEEIVITLNSLKKRSYAE